MYSNEDIASVHGFLKSTPEGSLRKMLVGGNLSDVHFRLLLKIARNCTDGDFASAFNSETLPPMRLSPGEIKAKEGFWGVCKAKLNEMGLLSLNNKKAA